MISPIEIIKVTGMAGIFAIVFAESGLFFGFFFPGDSLLFTAGLFAHAGIFPFLPLLVGCILCAIIGDNVGYITGKKIGPHLFKKEDSFFFKKHYVADAQKFYEKYGDKTIVLSRFIPIVRTFAPVLAGVGQMKYRKFFIFNVIGGTLWVFLMLFLGYYIGGKIPNAEHFLLPITLLISVVSLLPIFFRIFKHRSKSSF